MPDETPSPDLKKKAPKSSAKHGGHRNGSGRKKGTPNKLTADIKEAIIKAFNEAGGAEYLRKVAKSDPRTFCALLAKVLPTQVTADPSIPLQIIDRIEYVVIPSPKQVWPPRAVQGLPPKS